MKKTYVKMSKSVKEEGVYTIKRVKSLPKKGNANLLYILNSDSISKFYRWDSAIKRYEEITVGIGGSPDNLDASVLKTGYVDNDRIPESAIKQHEGSLVISVSQILDLPSVPEPTTNAEDLTSGTLDDDRLSATTKSSLAKADSAKQSVTEEDVKQHEAALEITESQISDLKGYLTDYTVTELDVKNHENALEITTNQISDYTPVDISGKQDTLVSGTNIKTVNGQSLLGSGDVDLSGLGGASTADAVTTTGARTNYTPSSSDVQSELEAIDNALGSIVVGEGVTENVLTENEYAALDETSQTNSRDYITDYVISPNLFPDGAGSISDSNDTSIWTVINGSIENVTDDVSGSSNALRFNGDGTNTIIAELNVPVEASTKYTVSGDVLGSGWASMILRVNGATLSPSVNISVANSGGITSWVSNSIDITTGSSATFIKIQLVQGVARSDQYGVVDNIKLTKKRIFSDFNDDEIYVKYKRVNDNSDAYINKTLSSYIYNDQINNTLSSNNLQNNIDELDAKIESLKSSVNKWYVDALPTGEVFAYNFDKSKYFESVLKDASVVLDSIYQYEVGDHLTENGIFGAFIEFAPKNFTFYSPVDILGPYPKNTEENISAIYIDGQIELTQFNFPVSGGIRVSDGIRFGMSGIRVYSADNVPYVLNFDAQGDGRMATRDGYLKDMFFSGRTPNPILHLENFFGVTLEDIFIRNFGGSAMLLRNVGDGTNYGNIVANQVKLLHNLDSTSYGLKIDRVGSKRMNLLQFGNLQTGRTDLVSPDAAGGNSYGTGVIFENTQNIVINQLTAEYDPVLVKANNSANITIMQLLGTIQDAPDYETRESIGLDIVNSNAINVMSGWLYGSSRAIPLKVSGDNANKQGNNITLMTQNGINPITKVQLLGASGANTEVNMWEDGSSNYLFISPQYKYYNEVALDGSSLGAPFTSDTTLSEALQTAAANGTSTGFGETIGTTAERPSSPTAPHKHFDTDLGYWITWNGTNWVDGSGTIR